MVKLTESAVYIRTKSSIENVKKLNLWGCGIDDISVCDKMQVLEILSLSLNDVKSLKPLQNCKNLKELYLRKNQIDSFDELEYLKDLPNLRVLWFDENPCVGDGGQEYRRKVVKMLPQLTKLDDKIITPTDHLEIDDSVPECDMHTSLYSARSNRSNSINQDMMCRSMYVASTSAIPTVFDRIMQPQMLHFGDTSDEEKPSSVNNYAIHIPVVTDETTTIYLQPGEGLSKPPVNLMSQSMYGTLLEEPSSNDGEDDWNDFSLEEERPMRLTPSRMFQSMHEGMGISEMRRPIGYGRSVSMPRRRTTSRNSSTSPAREHRLSKIVSAVSVLMDELDADGLRQVVDEAQRRMKKQR